MASFDEQVKAATKWFARDRFTDNVRLYSPREVVEQQGTLSTDYVVAREAAEAFYARLRRALRPAQVDHHLRSLLPGSGGRDEAAGHRRHLPRWLGHLRQGLDRARTRGPTWRAIP